MAFITFTVDGWIPVMHARCGERVRLRGFYSDATLAALDEDEREYLLDHYYLWGDPLCDGIVPPIEPVVPPRALIEISRLPASVKMKLVADMEPRYG